MRSREDRRAGAGAAEGPLLGPLAAAALPLPRDARERGRPMGSPFPAAGAGAEGGAALEEELDDDDELDEVGAEEDAAELASPV